MYVKNYITKIYKGFLAKLENNLFILIGLLVMYFVDHFDILSTDFFHIKKLYCCGHYIPTKTLVRENSYQNITPFN